MLAIKGRLCLDGLLFSSYFLLSSFFLALKAKLPALRNRVDADFSYRFKANEKASLMGQLPEKLIFGSWQEGAWGTVVRFMIRQVYEIFALLVHRVNLVIAFAIRHKNHLAI